jgi:hypothetical protein
MDGPTFSTLAYGISRGEEKVRMTSKGGVVGFANTAVWRMSPFVTGNKDFHGLLATNQANSQAEAVRLIQISVDRYPVIRLHETEQVEAELVQSAVDAMKANAGAAGDAMLRHVVTHQRQMADAVRDMMNRLAEHIPGTKYRFYRNHGACTLVMAKVARDLGVVDFDLDKMFEFTVGMLKDLAETVSVTNTVTAEDAFSRMMSALSHRILVTQEFRDKRNKSRLNRLMDAYKTRAEHRKSIVDRREEKDQVYGTIKAERDHQISLMKFTSDLKLRDKLDNVERVARMNEFRRLQTLQHISMQEVRYEEIQSQREEMLRKHAEEAKLALRFTLSKPVTAAVSPSHAQLLWWECDAADDLSPLTPAEEQIVLEPYYDDGSGKEPRYYQRNAIKNQINELNRTEDPC